MNTISIQQLQDLAHKLRIHSIEATDASKSGHPTSCSSIAEMMSVLFFKEMRYSLGKPLDPSSDRFVLSKGHAAPILYAAWAEAGLFPIADLLNLRKIDSDLEGHPTPRLNFIDVGTGSLGQGLSVGCGMAYVGKYFDKASYRIYVLVGDGESAEGSIWEALNFASHYKLDNLVVMFDVNRLGQSEATCLGHNMDKYKERLNAFGFNTLIINGHDIGEIIEAFDNAKTTKDRPTAIVAKTMKGKYFLEIEDQENWHGKPLGEKSPKVISHIKSLIKDDKYRFKYSEFLLSDAPSVNISKIKLNTPPSYMKDVCIATRFAYGTALSKLAASSNRVIALDGDTKNSTYSEKIKTFFLQTFFEPHGPSSVPHGKELFLVLLMIDREVRNAFGEKTETVQRLTIRMGAISQSNVNFVGSHCGVSIGEDGPSQMGLEDLALFRSIPGSTVFYPSDAVSCERAVELAANTKGICYIRTSRPNTPILYENNHKFQIGKAEVLLKSSGDVALIISSGVTLHEAIQAAEKLSREGLPVRVMDLFTVKPLDVNGIIENGSNCKNRIIVVEDHYAEGGIGEAVAHCVAHLGQFKVVTLAVPSVPRSGPPTELLEKYGINYRHIITAVKSVI